MTLDTAVFTRLMREKEESAVSAIAETMRETYRFGWMHKDYIERCAKDRLEKHQNELRQTLPKP